jgi:hypothetical protein
MALWSGLPDRAFRLADTCEDGVFKVSVSF